MKNAIILFALLSASTFLHTQTNPTPIATIEREEVGGGCFGQSMDYGDINGDGVNDLVVADTYYDGPAGQDAGRVYIFFGRNFSGTISAASADIKIDGTQPLQKSGFILVGNVDNDDYSDILIASVAYKDSIHNRDVGRTYLFYGKNLLGKSQLTVDQADVLFCSDSTLKNSGSYGLMDLDGDGKDDVFISAGQAIPNHPDEWYNRMFIFWGKNIPTHGILRVLESDCIMQGPLPTYFFGYNAGGRNAFSKGKDINGDGIKDYFISYHNGLPEYVDTVGIFFGGKTYNQDTIFFSQADLKILPFYDQGGYLGTGFMYAGYITGQKNLNIILSRYKYRYTPDYNLRYGRVYLFPDVVFTDDIDISQASNFYSGTIAGIFNGEFGTTVSTGDINQDGHEEIAIGSLGTGNMGAQFLFQGEEKYQDSLSDNDAEVKIIGNSSYSGLQNGSIIVDIIGTGRPQWLIAYDKRGSKINGFIDIYPSSVLTGVPDDPNPVLPKNAVLYQNYPNPFNPSTTIKYELPANSKVEIRIYNILGQEVRLLEKGSKAIGEHKIIWDGRDNQGKAVASGIYIYRLQFRNQIISKKMVLVR